MKKLIIATAISASLITGCASSSKPEAMVAAMTSQTTLSQTSKLRNAVNVGQVNGGKKTNPLWISDVNAPEFAEALKKSLVAHTILASSNATYRLDAELLKLKKPLIGTSMTVTSTVKYVLTDIETGAVVFNQEIETPYKAAFGDSWIAMERLRLANEGAIRANILEMIKRIIADVDGIGNKVAMR